jgi:hypothetical protein
MYGSSSGRIGTEIGWEIKLVSFTVVVVDAELCVVTVIPAVMSFGSYEVPQLPHV